jgi:hypothetical protein
MSKTNIEEMKQMFGFLHALLKREIELVVVLPKVLQ